jgi:hypothetical protein
MDYFLKILELILTPHIVWGGILVFFAYRFKNSFSILIESLSDRVKNVKGYKKTKDGHEVLFSEAQSINEPPAKTEITSESPNVISKPNNASWPEDLTDDTDALRNEVKSERAKAYYWEYCYLNFFLVRHTQLVLDWLVSKNSKDTKPSFHNYWKEYIVSEQERENVLSALNGHSLVIFQQDEILVTPKGNDYYNWRGAMPPFVIPGKNA